MFGTDGIRGVFGKGITCKLAHDVGRALAIKCGTEGKGIVVGRDNRQSGTALCMALISGILSQGIDVTDLGVVSTPAVGYSTRNNFCFGVVITASHNTSEYNGIKIFNNLGMKLSAKEESSIENIYKRIGEYALSEQAGKLKKKKAEDYFKFLDGFWGEQKFDLRVCFDCANGATTNTVKKIFKGRFKELVLINTSPDGVLINRVCGATNIGALRQCILQKKLDFGFAFDGDGDRIAMVDNHGNIINGDAILCMLTKYFLGEGENFCSVVGTILTNIGLEKFLKSRGIELIRTPVGDKYISEHMYKHKLVLGGEPSGHIILGRFNPTGDGVLCAIILIFALFKQGKNCKKILMGYKEAPQYQINIKYKSDHTVASGEFADLPEIVRKYTTKLGKNCRLVVRKSGTEPVVRVMIEGQNKAKIESILTEMQEEILSKV